MDKITSTAKDAFHSSKSATKTLDMGLTPPPTYGQCPKFSSFSQKILLSQSLFYNIALCQRGSLLSHSAPKNVPRKKLSPYPRNVVHKMCVDPPPFLLNPKFLS